MTENFQSEAYLTENMIGNSELDGKTIICDSKEMAILIAIRNIYFHPEQYDYTNNNIKNDYPYETDLSYADQILYVSKVLGVDPALNYAICQVGCNFNSPMFLTKNNPNNIKVNNVFETFPSTMAGFIEEAIELLKCKTDRKVAIISTSSSSVSSSDLSSSTKISNITLIYTYIMEHYDTIFGKQPQLMLSDAKEYILS